MDAVLIIHYTGPRTRAWNFISTRMKSVELTVLAESDALQILSIRSQEPSIFLQILDLIRDDIGPDLKAAYWLGNPQQKYHLHGKSAGWLDDYSTV